MLEFMPLHCSVEEVQDTRKYQLPKIFLMQDSLRERIEHHAHEDIRGYQNPVQMHLDFVPRKLDLLHERCKYFSHTPI